MTDMKQLELRIQRAKKLVQETKKQVGGPSALPKLRQVRKRLRRFQRKRRVFLAIENRLAKKAEAKKAESKKAEPKKQETEEKAAGGQPPG